MISESIIFLNIILSAIKLSDIIFIDVLGFQWIASAKSPKNVGVSDRSEQTKQAQIRLLFQQSGESVHCFSITSDCYKNVGA